MRFFLFFILKDLGMADGERRRKQEHIPEGQCRRKFQTCVQTCVYVDMCIGMCIGMRIGMCADMFADMCMCVASVDRHVC